MRFALLKQQVAVIGRTKTFDGVKLCLPSMLPERVTQLTSINPNDNGEVTITIIYKGKKRFEECQQLYGILFANIMKILKFVRFGQKNFDPTEPKVIPQHKLEIWPGYVTGLQKFVHFFLLTFERIIWTSNSSKCGIFLVKIAVEECHDGVMLCVDVTHRVLRQTPVLDVFQHAYQSARGNMQEFKSKVTTALIGAIVLTR